MEQGQMNVFNQYKVGKRRATVSLKGESETKPSAIQIEEQPIAIVTDKKKPKKSPPKRRKRGDLVSSKDQANIDMLLDNLVQKKATKTNDYEDKKETRASSPKKTIFRKSNVIEQAPPLQSQVKAPADVKKMDIETKPELSKESQDLINRLLQKEKEEKRTMSEETGQSTPKARGRSKGQTESALKSPLNVPQDNVIRTPISKHFSPGGKELMEKMGKSSARKQSLGKETSTEKLGMSLREKYAELLEEHHDFMLPVEYKKLQGIFEHLDRLLNFLLSNNRPTFWEEICKNLQNSMKVKINVHHLGQILTVLPESYEIKWGKNEKNFNEWEMILNFPPQEKEEATKATNAIEDPVIKRCLSMAKLTQRLDIFKEKLLEITKKYHKDFLSTLSKEEQKIDYDALRCWHSHFDVHKVPSIPEAPLPPKPLKEKVGNLNAFLNQSTTQNLLIKKAMEAVAKDHEKMNNNPGNQLKSSVSTQLSQEVQAGEKLGISEKLMKMIAEKERMIKEHKKVEEYDKVSKKGMMKWKDEACKVAQLIFQHYSNRNVSNMFFSQVVDYIKTTLSTFVLNQEQIVEIINGLAKKCPSWMKLIEHESGKLVRLNRSMPLSEVLATIDKNWSLE